MNKKVISTAGAPAAIGPYSQAVCANGFVFVSGQLPVDPQTGEVVQGGIRKETDMAMRNLQNVLEAAGSSLDKMVKTSVYLTSLQDFSEMNEAYAVYFKEQYPARVCFEVAFLPKNADIEIEAIALIGEPF